MQPTICSHALSSRSIDRSGRESLVRARIDQSTSMHTPMQEGSIDRSIDCLIKIRAHVRKVRAWACTYIYVQIHAHSHVRTCSFVDRPSSIDCSIDQTRMYARVHACTKYTYVYVRTTYRATYTRRMHARTCAYVCACLIAYMRIWARLRTIVTYVTTLDLDRSRATINRDRSRPAQGATILPTICTLIDQPAYVRPRSRPCS